MTDSPRWQLGVRRAANVQLRGPAGPVRARAYWPVAADPALAVFFTGGDLDDAEQRCLGWCGRDGIVVLAVSCRTGAEAIAAVEWAADHAAELGADPRRVLVSGESELVATVLGHARDQGWPVLRRTDEFSAGESSEKA